MQAIDSLQKRAQVDGDANLTANLVMVIPSTQTISASMAVLNSWTTEGWSRKLQKFEKQG